MRDRASEVRIYHKLFEFLIKTLTTRTRLYLAPTNRTIKHSKNWEPYHMAEKIFDAVKPGVLSGKEVSEVYRIARENEFALPAVNVVGTDSINGVLEAAKEVNAPVVIQFSNGGGAYYAGKGLKLEGQKAQALGTISGAYHVHRLAEAYGVPVILHTDHAAKNYFLGLTFCWTKVNNASLIQANHCLALTCWTFLKSLWKRTSKSVLNT